MTLVGSTKPAAKEQVGRALCAWYFKPTARAEELMEQLLLKVSLFLRLLLIFVSLLLAMSGKRTYPDLHINSVQQQAQLPGSSPSSSRGSIFPVTGCRL